MNIDDSITDHIIVQPEGSDNDAMKQGTAKENKLKYVTTITMITTNFFTPNVLKSWSMNGVPLGQSG